MKTAETLPETDDNCVSLDQPIKRGATQIDSISLRKPTAGELRGVLLVDLLNLDVASLIKVIPRISNPGITAPEAAGMDPADLLAIGGKIAGFLLQRSAKADVFLVA